MKTLAGALALLFLCSCAAGQYTIIKEERKEVDAKHLVTGTIGAVLTGASIVLDILKPDPVGLVNSILTIPMVKDDFEEAFYDVKVEKSGSAK